MTSISASPDEDKNRIERWREETSATPERHYGIIARMSDTCLELLRILIQHSNPTWITTSGNRTLRQCFATLQLWEHGHGVLDGRLDGHLERSTEVRQTTIEVLLHLCGCLLDGISSFVLSQVEDASIKRQHALASDLYSQRRWFLKAADESSSEDESDSDDDHEEEKSASGRADVMAHRVKTYTNCLMGLGTALVCPAPDDVHDDKPSVVEAGPRFAHDYHINLIQAKYPAADTPLLQVLGQISWSRFLRMQHERDNNTATTEEPQEMIAPGVPKSIGPNSEFQDSGIGTSLAKTQSSYAPSTVSFMTSISGGERVRIPPLPAEGKKGLPFECTACGKLVRATNNREWRKHLYADLQPYTCFHHGCPFKTSPFPSRQMWADHLELEHKFGPTWESIECPLCLELTGDGKSAILTHLARHMEDIALVALPPTVESDAESDTSVHEGGYILEVEPKSEKELKQSSETNVVNDTGMKPVGRRLKVYELRNNDWFDRGTGFIQNNPSVGDKYLRVFSEDDPETLILEEYLEKDNGYQRQDETLIVWTQVSGEDMALSFQEPKDCEAIWEYLTDVLYTPVRSSDREVTSHLRLSKESLLHGSGVSKEDSVKPPSITGDNELQELHQDGTTVQPPHTQPHSERSNSLSSTSEAYTVIIAEDGTSSIRNERHESPLSSLRKTRERSPGYSDLLELSSELSELSDRELDGLARIPFEPLAEKMADIKARPEKHISMATLLREKNSVQQSARELGQPSENKNPKVEVDHVTEEMNAGRDMTPVADTNSMPSNAQPSPQSSVPPPTKGVEALLRGWDRMREMREGSVQEAHEHSQELPESENLLRTQESWQIIEEALEKQAHELNRELQESEESLRVQESLRMMEEALEKQERAHRGETLTSVHQEGEVKIVWFCSICGSGPCGAWQNACTACHHIRCGSCRAEEAS